MSVFPDQAFEDFVSALKNKFPELGDSLDVRFKDEDGDMLSMQDEGDFEAAVDVARYVSDSLCSRVLILAHAQGDGTGPGGGQTADMGRLDLEGVVTRFVRMRLREGRTC